MGSKLKFREISLFSSLANSILTVVKIPEITAVDGQIPDQIRQQKEYRYIAHLTVFYGRNNSFLSNNKNPKPIRDTNIKIFYGIIRLIKRIFL